MLPQMLEGFRLNKCSAVLTVSTLITLPHVLGPFFRAPNSEPFPTSKLVNWVSRGSEVVSFDSSVPSSLSSCPFSLISSSVTTGILFGFLER